MKKMRTDLNDCYIRTKLHLEENSKLQIDDEAIKHMNLGLERSLDSVEAMIKSATNELADLD